MKASPDFLIALSRKLHEIANNCSDMNTVGELYEFIEAIDKTVEQLLDK
jgi:hypothetical protein